MDATIADFRERAPLENSGVVHRLTKPKRGSLRSFCMLPEKRKYRPKDHVRVQVDALGLNFRDVLIALNRYPDPNAPLGVEFAGRILTSDSTRLPPGSRVLGVMLDSFATEVVLPAAAVARYPSWLKATEAAALPVAYLTAWRGLVEMANLRPGQTVLIHHGTGGVGLAAIHLSQRIGAQVIATAGCTKKRAMLREMGVNQVFKSRDDSFSRQVLEATHGRGADVVLGALPPELVQANLNCISNTGHFVDMGKIGLPDENELSNIAPGIRYSKMSLDADALANPDWVGRTLELLNGEFETRTLPTLPVTSYPVQEADQAFRSLAKAQHTGKITLSVTGSNGLP